MQRAVRTLRVGLLAALAVAVLAPAPAEAQIAWGPCGDSNDFACGHLAVPLDAAGSATSANGPAGSTPAGSSGEVITLAMRRHLAPVGGAKDAAIALAGGPGQAAIPLAERFARLLGPILATRDLIVFDQRGIGLSHPLSCAAFEHLGARRLTPRAIGICAGQLGAARGSYTTADTVADIEAIRQAGGYDKLVLYGTSYGTKVAERYAQAYPAHVEALVLDSVVPPNGPDPLERSTFAAIPRVLRDVCAADACARIAKDPVGDLARLVNAMRRGPARGRAIDGHGHAHPVRVTSQDLLDILYAGDFNPFLRAEFPAAVRSAMRGDTAALARMLARAEGEEGEESEESLTEGFDSPLYFATTCEEQQFPWNRAAGPATRLREALAYARGLAPGTFAPFTFANALAGSGISACAYWPFATLAPEADSAPMPDVPTLILSGADDLRTPTAGAQEVAAEIPDAQLLVVPHTGHSVLGSALGGCPTRALQAFFKGRPIKQCRGSEAPPSPAPDPLPPRRIADVRPARGASGPAGRALGAVLLTLQDFNRQSALEFFSRLAGRRSVLSLLEVRLGGLRAGWAKLSEGRLALHRYTYVPGVAVSGAIAAGKGTLRVTGSRRARGTLRLNGHGRLSGVLGGRRVGTAAQSLLP